LLLSVPQFRRKEEKENMGRFRDLTGVRFGKLLVIERAPDKTTGSKPKSMWRCRCDCGKEVIVWSSALTQGTTVSCGCKKRKHGYSHRERLYDTWLNMKRRCKDPNNKRYEQYGGRGISVCEEWNDYSNFRSWALSSGYSDDLTIDRIDVNGNYCPENCRWANLTEQMNNTTRNRVISFDGKTMTMAQWAKHLGISYGTINHRVQRGWSMERIVSTPQRRY
jgi:hypothetical protein